MPVTYPSKIVTLSSPVTLPDDNARANVGAVFAKIQGDDQSGCVPVSWSSARPSAGRLPAEVQFEVAPNAVTHTADPGTAPPLTGPRQGSEEHVVTRLELASCRRPEPIDLGFHRAWRFTVERGQTPDERLDKRVEVVIVRMADKLKLPPDP
jgi:hypothetical protein